MGASLTPGVLAAILSGCHANTRPGGFFTAREQQMLGELADAIIPRTDTPGARDAGVPEYIEMILANFTPADRVQTLRSQLAWMSTWLRDQNAETLEALADRDRTQILTALDEQAFGSGRSNGVPPGDPPLFAIIKPLTVAGYYTSDAGARQELHQMPYGPYQGDVAFESVGKTWS
jgi:hypothetical protein